MSTSHYLDKEILIDWVKKVLSQQIVSIQEIAITAYSYVVRIETLNQVYYLKKTPPSLYREVKVIDILRNKCYLENVPFVTHCNDDLSCFLMLSGGSQTLRTFFGERFNVDLFHQGHKSYVHLQKASSGHVSDFLEIGIPDWRLHQLENVYANFINDEEKISVWELSLEDQKRIESSQKMFGHLIDDIHAFELQDVLNHSDFHPNAMLLDETTGEINIIDLGEVTIGNPLFPLSSCLTNYLEHRYHIRSDMREYQKIKQTLLNEWGLSGKDPEDIVEIIGPLNYALTFRELMNLSGKKFPKWKEFVRPTFFDFLNHLEGRYR